MKYALLILLVCTAGWAQSKISPAPEQYLKIKFSYLQLPRLFIDENNFYGSVEIIGNSSFKDRMEVKTVDGLTYAFVPISKLSEDEKRIVIGMFGHNTYKITGVYNKKRNKTEIQYSLPKPEDDPNREMLRNLFGEPFSGRVRKTLSFDFDRGEVYSESGLVSRTSSFELSKNVLKLEADQKFGYYEDQPFSRTVFTNAAYPNEHLSRYISPILPFANTGGIEKIESRNYTIDLVSVTYEQ